jgi:hypothetical protein
MPYQNLTYNTNRKVANFSDFTSNIGSEKEELKKMKRGEKPNSEDQQHIGNRKFKFNKVTHKMDDLSPEEVQDKLDAIDELEETNEGIFSDRRKNSDSSVDDKIWNIVVDLYQNHTSIQAGYDDIMKLIK